MKNISDTGNIESQKEDSRSKLANRILMYYCGIVILSLSISVYLILKDKSTIENSITFVLAVASLFSGLMGAVFSYYFSNSQNQKS